MKILDEARLNNFAFALQKVMRGAVLLHEAMSKHTSFRIGGPADIFLLPQDAQDIETILTTIPPEIPLCVIGNGTNLLVRDKGIRGVVIQIGHSLSKMQQTGSIFRFEAGCPLAKAARAAGSLGYAGMEFAAGIPGSVGGGVYMNAGAYGGEMSQIVTEIETLDKSGRRHVRTVSELGFAYRRSALMENGEIIYSVTVNLHEDDKKEIAARMADFNARRFEKQPLDVPSAGSTFKRPQGYFAGRLIEECGLKGFSVGAAQISPRHAGFVVNNGGATAAQVMELIAKVRECVQNQTGVTLQPEICILGEE